MIPTSDRPASDRGGLAYDELYDESYDEYCARAHQAVSDVVSRGPWTSFNEK